MESYGAPAYLKAPEICLGGCPSEAPCQSSTSGACVAKIQHVAAPMYEAAPTTYAAQEYGGEQEATGYRRLSGNGCPVGTFDTSWMNFVPISGWVGDNMIERSENMTWYK